MLEHIIEDLRHLIADKLDRNITLDAIDPEAPLLRERLNLDSLAVVELITVSEEHFGIEFGEDGLTIEAFANVRTLAGVIAARRVPAGA